MKILYISYENFNINEIKEECIVVNNPIGMVIDRYIRLNYFHFTYVSTDNNTITYRRLGKCVTVKIFDYNCL